MLMLAPFLDVHRRHDERLRALTDQLIRHTRVAKVIANAHADFAPRRVPHVLFRGWQSVFEKLHWHRLALLKNHFAVRADNKRRVAKLSAFQRMLSANEQKLLILAAPRADFSGNRPVESVFTQNE